MHSHAIDTRLSFPLPLKPGYEAIVSTCTEFESIVAVIMIIVTGKVVHTNMSGCYSQTGMLKAIPIRSFVSRVG